MGALGWQNTPRGRIFPALTPPGPARHAPHGAHADLGPKERSNAYKLVQFVATHLNVTVVMCSHSWVQLIPRLRRACDTIVMWAPASGGSDQLTFGKFLSPEGSGAGISTPSPQRPQPRVLI